MERSTSGPMLAGCAEPKRGGMEKPLCWRRATSGEAPAPRSAPERSTHLSGHATKKGPASAGPFFKYFLKDNRLPQKRRERVVMALFVGKDLIEQALGRVITFRSSLLDNVLVQGDRLFPHSRRLEHLDGVAAHLEGSGLRGRRHEK